MTRESLSAFHEGTILSVSPVTIRTAHSNNYHQLCSIVNLRYYLSSRVDCQQKEIHHLTMNTKAGTRTSKSYKEMNKQLHNEPRNQNYVTIDLPSL